jgi:class 3 adenylate cyclase
VSDDELRPEDPEALRREVGDTVNVASRLESTCPVGRIHVSEGVANGLVGRYRLEPRGGVELKGKGTLATYLLLGRVEERPAPGPTLAE